MNHYETNTNGTMVNTTPLFASVWLALFCVVRKNINERRLSASTNTDKLRQIKKN